AARTGRRGAPAGRRAGGGREGVATIETAARAADPTATIDQRTTRSWPRLARPEATTATSQPAIASDTVDVIRRPMRTAFATMCLPEEIEVREARKHRLAADGGVLERDRDLLVAPRQLARDHDSVAPASMSDAIAVAVLPFARDDRPRRTRRPDASRRARGSPERSRPRATLERLSASRQVARRTERLTG